MSRLRSDTKSGGTGVGISTVLLIVFLVLKLAGLINWPWVWVLSPLWISLCVFAIEVLVIVIVCAIKSSR